MLALKQCFCFRPLVFLGLKVFHHFEVMKYLQISEKIMYNWLAVIEGKYWASNTYHNSTHAADVMQASAYFLDRDRLRVSVSVTLYSG